jgi:hypothetical protein
VANVDEVNRSWFSISLCTGRHLKSAAITIATDRIAKANPSSRGSTSIDSIMVQFTSSFPSLPQ